MKGAVTVQNTKIFVLFCSFFQQTVIPTLHSRQQIKCRKILYSSDMLGWGLLADLIKYTFCKRPFLNDLPSKKENACLGILLFQPVNAIAVPYAMTSAAPCIMEAEA